MGRTQSWPIPVIPYGIHRGYKRVLGAAGGNTGGSGAGLFPKGNIWFVDSSNPGAVDSGGNPLSPGPRNQGTDPATPFKTLNFAIGGAVNATTGRTPSGVKSNNGDIVIVMPGHVETMGATAITMALAGVTVVFAGDDLADRAQMQLTNTAAQLIISGAGNHFICPTFVTGIDAVAQAVSVTGAGNIFEDVEFYDAAAKATTWQFGFTATATRCKIKGYRYYPSSTGTQKTEAIRLVGTNYFELDDAYITGSFSTGVINNITTAFVDARFRSCYLNNLNTGPKPAMAILTTSTGTLIDCSLVIASGAHWLTAGHSMTADMATGEQLPGTVPPTVLTAS